MSVYLTSRRGKKAVPTGLSAAAVAMVCVTSACMSTETASQSNISSPASISTMSDQGVKVATSTPAKSGTTMQVVGKGPARTGRPVYICGPSGGGMKSSCYQM